MLPNYVELSNEEFTPILSALFEAFPSHSDIQRLVLDSLDSMVLGQLSPSLGPYYLALDLLRNVQSAGRMKALLMGMLRLRPENRKLFNAVAAKLAVESFYDLSQQLNQHLPEGPAPDPCLLQAEVELMTLRQYAWRGDVRITSSKNCLPLLLHLADLQKKEQNNLPPLIEFIEYAAQYTGNEQLRRRLRAWSDTCAQRLNVPKGRLQDWRVAIQQSPQPRYSVVVKIEHVEPSLTVHAFLIDEDTQQQQVLFLATVATETGLLTDLNRLFAKAMEDGPLANAIKTSVEMPIEFITPRSLLCVAWDQIEISVDEDFPIILGETQPVFIRPLEKRNPVIQNKLETKRKRINDQLGQVVVLSDARISSLDAFRKQVASEDLVAVAITSPPPRAVTPDQRKTDVVAGCIAYGVPVVLWVRQSVEDAPSLQEHLRELLADLRAAPKRLKAARTSSNGTVVTQAVRGHLSLLWDVTARNIPAVPLEPPSVGG